MPSGLEFFVSHRYYKDFSSSHCELNFVLAYAAKGNDGMSCSSNEFTVTGVPLPRCPGRPNL